MKSGRGRREGLGEGIVLAGTHLNRLFAIGAAARKKRNGPWGTGSGCAKLPQCDWARLRRTRTRGAAALAVLVPAGCGQAPQKPNRLSVLLPAEYVKH
jgi:hypothetical protein